MRGAVKAVAETPASKKGERVWSFERDVTSLFLLAFSLFSLGCCSSVRCRHNVGEEFREKFNPV